MRRSPRDTEESARKISRRALLLGGAQAALVTGLALRMRQLQIVDSKEYRLLSDQNRINIRLLPPARGLIFDRNGILLAGNEQNYSAVILREDAGNVPAVLAKLAELIPLSKEEIARTIHDVKRHSPFVPITVSDRLSWDQLSRVAVNSPALPGISPQVGLSRTYPLVEDLAHVVGYVGPVSEADLKNNPNPDPLLQIPKFQVGKLGVEVKLEDKLRGTAGIERVEVNSVGRVMRKIGEEPGRPGENIQLTIDAKLQDFLMARLAGQSAAVVVMDVQNGDVLASVSAPSFNPNLFVRGISQKNYDAYRNNDHRPLVNKAVQGVYPPGSTFKIITGLAALHSGKLTLTDKVYCPGYLKVGKRIFHCWKHGGHGWLDLEGAITQSCDVFFYTAAERCGIEAIASMAKRMGLGKAPELPMSSIASGLTPNKQWKRRHYKRDWLIGDTINSAIGQGYVLASPLQLAIMVSRLAAGHAVVPRLIKSIDQVEVPIAPAAPLDLSATFIDAVRKGTWGVVNSIHGTAHYARIDDKSMIMAGKTGTSQVRNITAAERAAGLRPNDLPWKERDHALFVAYAPFDAPKVAVGVVIEHGGPQHQAAPIGRDALLYALTGGVPPLSAIPRGYRGQAKDEFDSLQLRDIRPEPPVRTRA